MDKKVIKFSLLCGTLFALILSYPVIVDSTAQFPVINIVAGYVASFACFYFSQMLSLSEKLNNDETQPNMAHIEALYRQAMIVVKNAEKTNAVFKHQLAYVQKLIEKSRHLQPGPDFERTHEELTHELSVLEKHVQHITVEMQKNVRLGEKLQQTVANIDPEIGIL
ncbi:hypothetical protein [Bermanella sp. R86510]|uniref:hypothetical protein n=1 Tax=unclassified Bermanella TaxID=2627862 RepID=UPI0037CC0478